MAINPGTNLNSVPSATKATLSDNYLDLASTSGQGWAQQYVPDLMEKEAEVFGPRTISGFLAQVGAEEAMTADQVVWSEQGRLHLSYKGHIANATQQTGNSNEEGGTFEIDTDIDGNSIGTSSIDHGIRKNDMVLIADASATARGIVTDVTNDQISVALYDAGNSTATFANAGLAAGSGDSATILVYGSEFAKGDDYQGSSSRQANEPQFKSFQNKPIIMKDYYEVSGSDASRIGWVEVSSEEGASGYLWYLKAESDTRARFTDYVEMAMLESKKTVAANSKVDAYLGTDGTTLTGTEGLFSAIEDRGNVSTGVNGVNAATDLAEFDAILAEFDKQGAIEENMLFLNRGTSLAIDDMLASMNSYGAGGTSYGVFDNDEDMALNLGFSGFRRGSYDFYKSDFRYLNDKATRGGINERDTVNAIRGVIIPAGTSSVYDQTVGQSIKRPFLHVRYRASQTDDRRMKTWVTGSVGAATSALDAMQLHFLTERCLIVQGANNFMLLQ
tara:strand:- start:3061 stop:4566 length:1506 start_codon:yes stop_codon:yes gene_type:complete